MRLLVHIKIPGEILPYGRIPPENSIEGGNIKRDIDPTIFVLVSENAIKIFCLKNKFSKIF